MSVYGPLATMEQFAAARLGEQHAASRPGLWRFAAAGALLGFAADIKIDYVLFGLGAARALLSRRNQSSADTLYRAFLPHSWHHDLGMMATVLVVAVAILALRRLPPGPVARPAIRPAVAVCAAWLFLWPYQLPWYDAMIICVLVLYPASRLDWLVAAVTLVALCVSGRWKPRDSPGPGRGAPGDARRPAPAAGPLA